MPYTIGSGGIPEAITGRMSKTRGTAPFQRTKSISYKSGNSDQIYSIGETTSATGSSGSIPSAVVIQNTGVVPLLVMVGYTTYSDGTTIESTGDARYIHYMVMPGETLNPPVRAVIMTADDDNVTQFTGTVVENTAPSSVNSGLLWKDITADLGADVDATTDPITITTASNHTNFFRQGDLIQIGRGTTQADLEEANHYREILRVKSITNSTTMVCERALHGTNAGDNDSTNWNQGHTSGFPIFLPFFNAYHDVDKFSVAQTDSQGKFKCTNFFGQGRAVTALQGIVPGSVAIKFYTEGAYQELGLTGITSSSSTSLTASGSYWFKIAIDGGTPESINFTVDSSNTKWGGPNGVIYKIQSALDAKYNNSASNTFQQKSSVGIVGGDVRFTSGSNLSTSAIALTAGTDGASASYNIFAQQNGWFPALANIDAAVAARLPDDVVYDNVTYSTSPTNVFGFDDGNGRLTGMCSGTINYETGALNMTGCPVDAEFVYSVAHTSAFSGKLSTSSATKGGSLMDICVNTPSQKREGSVSLKVY